MHNRHAANKLPVTEEELEHPTRISAPGELDAVPQEPPPSRTMPRILVVEDDSTLATLEAAMLTAYGYSVDTVASGELALHSLHHSLPDLVVLDLELTGAIQGWDVLQALRTITTIPVLLTTSSLTTVREQLLNRGETRLTLDHLPKPYPMQTFLKRIKRMLIVAPQSRAESAPPQ